MPTAISVTALLMPNAFIWEWTKLADKFYQNSENPLYNSNSINNGLNKLESGI